MQYIILVTATMEQGKRMITIAYSIHCCRSPPTPSAKGEGLYIPANFSFHCSNQEAHEQMNHHFAMYFSPVDTVGRKLFKPIYFKAFALYNGTYNVSDTPIVIILKIFNLVKMKIMW